MFSHEQARTFYDRFGARQDWQRFYEDRALGDLVAHSDFGHASSVFEFGCGTGRIAENLLSGQLPDTARYLAVDASSTMIALAQGRLARFQGRAEARMVDGGMALAAGANQYDRFLSTYVVDLLEDNDIRALLTEAHRILVPGGLLCLVSLTCGDTLVGRVVETAWRAAHSHNPALVGGCRPVLLQPYLEQSAWRTCHRNRITSFGISSEILVAEKRAS